MKDEEIDRHLGQMVRAMRISSGMSQGALGKALGVNYQQVQKYENGVNRMSAATLFRAASLFGTPIQDFFVGVKVSPTCN